ncbi:hypothetical protein K469DRAFT_701524 [Zopfia rhizophila CBS 207.26]|uniref:Endonuclease/exonuclease/phosphatase domain-containing protein n=1 Tax=Zopfia rhizophila CBS 207.26 TaxID=1314779 RepID=A0A6A6D895_9PEZI|nr:hypothetical protein K469DRAFT_701524 [Zopfia rhizophila CBS 207.26]
MSNQTPKLSPILEALTAKLAEGPPQRREDAFYKPRPQPYWFHDGKSWIQASTSSLSNASPPSPFDTSAIRLMSWNIDILVGFVEERMAFALDHLQGLVSQTPSFTPILIYLQEMGQSDLAQIREAAWIQSNFLIMEYDERNWLTPLYGTTMLVDRRLKIESVFRVPWVSKFERDGLFVDIGLERDGGEKGEVLRLCNAHLESLVADPPVRPLQLEAAGKYLRENEVQAALLAGDLNAIQPFDHTLHLENGLKDIYLELGGKEDSDEGCTWGYQVPHYLRNKFGCSRMDKILFRGAINAKRFERVGMGVKVAEDKRQKMRDAGEEEWVTDHYGVMGDFELEGWKLVGNEADGNKVMVKLS